MRKDLRGKLMVLWLLAAILLVAAGLRLYNLSEESLWLDECFTLDYASKSFTSLIETLKNDVHPVGYYLPQHVLIGQLGTSEFILRILSVFFGVLAGFLTYLLARKLFSWKEGLLAAFFMSISYTSILYSQDAKMYSMFAAFFLLSLLAFIRFLERPSLPNTLFFSVSVALLLYTHIIGLVISAVYVAIYLLMFTLEKKRFACTSSYFFEKYKTSSRFFLALFIVFLLYLPWLEILLSYQLPLLYNFLGIKLIEKVGLNLLPLVSVALILVTLSCFLLSYLSLNDKINLDKWFYFVKRSSSLVFTELSFSILILLFIIFDFLLSRYFFSSVSLIRFSFFILPLFYVLLSRKLLKMKNHHWAIFLFTLLIMSASFELYTYYDVDSKEQFREAADYIETSASPADVLFLHRATIAKLCFDYYYSGNAEEVRLIKTGEDDHLLTERVSGKRDAYLILSHNFHTLDYFKSHLDSLYEFKEEKKFIGVTIYKYEVSKS